VLSSIQTKVKLFELHLPINRNSLEDLMVVPTDRCKSCNLLTQSRQTKSQSRSSEDKE